MRKSAGQIEEKFMANKNCLLFIISTFCLFSMSYSQPYSAQIDVKDLRYEWMVSSNLSENDYIPYVNEIHDPALIHIFIDLNRYSKYHLSLNIPKETSLLVQNEIVDYQKQSTTVYWSIDSMKTQYQKEHIMVAIFSEEHLANTLSTRIVDLNPISTSNMEIVDFDSEVRSQNAFKDFNTLSIFIVFIFMVILRVSQSSILNEYFSFKKIFTVKAKSEVLYSMSLFSTSNLSVLIFYGVVAGFSLINIVTWIEPHSLSALGYDNTFKALVLSFGLSIVIVFLIVIKFLLIKIVDIFFLFRKATAIHFYEYLRLTILIAFIVFMVVLFNNFSNGILLNTYLKTTSLILLFLLIGRSTFVFLKLNKLQSFRKLHLFSYLCTTEIIPLIILLKIFKTYVEVF